MLLHYVWLSLNCTAHMAIYSLWCYTALHHLTHTPLSLFRTEQGFNLPVTSVTAPTAAGTAPRAGLAGWIMSERVIYFSAESPTQASMVWADLADFALQRVRHCWQGSL